jgi:FkbM family methyltransferase
LSNTLLLEKEYGWNGIPVEPGKNWREELVKNRKTKIDFRCVAASSKDYVTFSEATSPELSTVAGFENHDQNKRTTKSTYSVETVSLIDLLIEYEAPKIIDYISIDTEGTEFDILKNFNFGEYKFKIMTVEHNFTSERDKIFQLLTANGYHRIWSEFTQFDDWYVHPAII